VSATTAARDPAVAALWAIHAAAPLLREQLASYKGLAARSGKAKASVSASSSRELVDLALALYSEEAMAVARRVKVYAPRAPHVRRFASAPLRRYVDILAQRQLLAILRGSQPLSPERARAAMGDAHTRRGVLTRHRLQQQRSIISDMVSGDGI